MVGPDGTHLFFIRKETITMKYCPFCGAELYSGTVSFCSQCGKRLNGQDEPPVEAPLAVQPRGKPEKVRKRRRKEKAPKPPKQKKVRKSKRRQKTDAPKPAAPPADDCYDGYYNDVLPPDLDRLKDGLDQKLIKKIVLLCLGAGIIISMCVALLYVL